jgi:putative transposase
MQYRKGEVDLCLVGGKWYLAATWDIPETEEFDAADWLGIDFSIVNLAVDGDSRSHTGIERVRSQLARRNARLQKRGTKAAKRHLKKLAGTEARFRKRTNHVISKALVQTAPHRSRRCVGRTDAYSRAARRSQPACLHSWSLGQLRAFVTYKAACRCACAVR